MAISSQLVGRLGGGGEGLQGTVTSGYIDLPAGQQWLVAVTTSYRAALSVEGSSRYSISINGSSVASAYNGDSGGSFSGVAIVNGGRVSASPSGASFVAVSLAQQ